MNSMEGEALDELVELLKADPRKIFATLRWAQSKAMTAKVEAETADEQDANFHETDRKLYRLPKEYLKQFLPTLPGFHMRVTSEQLGCIERSENDSLRNLFYFAMGCSSDTPWPPFCHKKEMFKQVFTRVAKEEGDRLQHVVFKEVGDKLYVDWTKSGMHTFGPEGDKKTFVRHHSGHQVDLEDSSFTGAFEVLYNWHELKAELKVRKQVTKITDFFKVDFVNSLKARQVKIKGYLENIANETNIAAHDDDDDETSGAKSSAIDPSPLKPMAPPGRLANATAKAALSSASAS